MLYTTDLVTVEVPEFSKITLTLGEMQSDALDLTSEAVLIIDRYVRGKQNFMEQLQTIENSSGASAEESLLDTETLTQNNDIDNLNDKVLLAEINLPEEAIVTIADITLTHQKAGEILSLSVEELLEQRAQIQS